MHLLAITDVDRVLIENFSCILNEYDSGQGELRKDHEKNDLFLKEEALLHHNNQLVRTYLLLNEDKNKVIGFFSLYNEEIAISNGQKKSFKFKGSIIYQSMGNDVYPAIRLHQFAMDREYQGRRYREQKYSAYLIGYVFENVRQVAEKSGCMFIGLEATDNAISFYEYYDFKILKKTNGHTLPYLIFKVADLLV
ncbi:hypothetical protein AB3U99_21330 [Niallia sp. JL1B1071]|uniref:hypothetical protein n=1 Tax=Niallia tiangongensis TaxID=3237105 RepID=UPI0037DBFADB